MQARRRVEAFVRGILRCRALQRRKMMHPCTDALEGVARRQNRDRECRSTFDLRQAERRTNRSLAAQPEDFLHSVGRGLRLRRARKTENLATQSDDELPDC